MAINPELIEGENEHADDMLSSCSPEFRMNFKLMTEDLQRRIRSLAKQDKTNLETAYKEICDEDAADGHSPLYWQR